MHCSSKSYPKEPSIAKVMLLKHPLPLTTELILYSDNGIEHTPSPLFLKHPAPPSPCTIDTDDASNPDSQPNDSASILSYSEESISLKDPLTDDSTEENTTPRNDSSGTRLRLSFLKKIKKNTNKKE